MKLPHAKHPVYGLLQAAIVLSCLILMLVFNYNSTDMRDGETVGAVAMTWVASSVIRMIAVQQQS